MAFVVLALFIAVPLLEIAVFIKVGGFLGLGWTLFLVVLTALIGTYLLRRQGIATLRRAQETMARNEMPIRELFDGACLLVGGLLLLTPGFVTDSLGALLLLPFFREFLRRMLAHRLAASTIHVQGFPGEGFPGHGQGPDHGPAADGDIIDGEYEEVQEPTDRIDPPTNSKWGRR